ncbi:MAG TPA: ABC transporter permease [Chitinophagales bacterium]|nr:ABC transporter permease [Chitinophagales bacterium]HPA35279.1 ABC transporter permease [Chitinophagales bacterium]HQO31228.1 ABC transporter permease [Chitinophagales bacterium]
MASAHDSPLRKTWKRLKKNKPAIVSLFVIIIAVLLAILGPSIAPDKTPDADDQVLELANVNPGFTTQMLLVRKNRDERSPSFLSKVFFGQDNPYQLIPINSYKMDGQGNMVVQAFKGEGRTPQEMTFSLADVVYALSAEEPEVQLIGQQLSFVTFSGDKKTADIAALQKQITAENLVTKKYRLGTDGYGRDILSRLLFGVRVSLSVGLVAVLISLTIGIFLGSIAGFFRGWVDDVIMWLINVIWAVPTILLAMAIRFAIGDKINSFLAIFIAVGLSMWVEVARIVRGQVLMVREMEYVQAARGLGFANPRIILKHILPNIIGPIMVIAAADFASAILIEAGLSFVGIGVKPPTPSWGTMLNDHRTYLLTPDKAFLALAPGICIMVMVLAFNLLGNGLRDAFDVKGKTV